MFKRRKHLSFKNFKAKYGDQLAEAEKELHRFLAGEDASSKGEPRNACVNDFIGPDGEFDFSRVFPNRETVDHFEELRIIELLRMLGKEGYSEAFKFVLLYVLGSFGVKVPEGVLSEFRRDPGAPKNPVITSLCDQWLRDGGPVITPDLVERYALRFFPADYEKSRPGSNKRKNLLSRVRTPLLNCQKNQQATKSPQGIL